MCHNKIIDNKGADMKKILILFIIPVILFSMSLEEYLQDLQNQAKKTDSSFKGFSAKRGEKIFSTYRIGKRGKKIACISCHTSNLHNQGENIFTGKKIAPLSPKANPKRLTDIKKVKKWLRRNFKDVYKREGTPQEKGDVLLYILNQ